MCASLLEPRRVRMPHLAPGDWLNVQRPLTRESLRGAIVLVDFWDYTCVNCLRTLPYLQEWHSRYAELGLIILGIHSPEFKFAHYRPHLERAIATHQIQYPILLDNQYENWSLFANKAWPTKYLIDQDGYIRFQRQGEGYYQETERAIQLLLRQRNPHVMLPELLPPLRQEDTPGAVCYRPTPELYAGYQGGGLFGGALGNESGYLPDQTIFYKLPSAEQRKMGHFYLDGAWQAWQESVAFAGQSGGKIIVPYTAVTVNAVLAPSADAVEMALELRPSDAEPIIELRQNGRFLDPFNAGEDVMFGENGQSFVCVEHPRMMQLINNNAFQVNELTLTFCAQGLAAFAFTFTSCMAPAALPDETNTIQVK